MRNYKFTEPALDGTAVTIHKTELEIITEYLPFWYGKMLELHRNPALYTMQDVINDWNTVHWAELCGEIGDNDA